MNDEDLKKSYPEYTVFICRDSKGVITQIQPFDVYVSYRKTYAECKEKLEKRREDKTYSSSWEERQDKDLYEVACILRRRSVSKKGRDFALDSLRQVISDLEDICEDLDLDEQGMEDE